MNEGEAWVLVETDEGETAISASDDDIAAFWWNWSAWTYGGPETRRAMMRHYRQMPPGMQEKLHETLREVA